MAKGLQARPGTNALLERVTALDKSTGPFRAQVDEAYKILQIQLDENSFEEITEEGRKIEFGPLEQWTLRWLLKRFGEKDLGVDSPCLEPRAWLLLRILVARLPTTVTARLLLTYDFPAAIQRTFVWLVRSMQAECSLVLQAPKTRVSRESSSSATVQESSDGLGEKSKKRKRGDIDGNMSKENPAVVIIARLYTTVCSAIAQVVARTVEDLGGTEEFAAEHMKAALKTSPEIAAKIVGSAFRITAEGLSGKLTDILPGVDYHAALIAPIALWGFRSAGGDEMKGLASSRAFSMDCLIPALQLLTACSSSSYNLEGLSSVRKAVEALLAAFMIIPSRAGFIGEKRKTSQDGERVKTLLEELLEPLTKETMSQLADVTGSPQNFLNHIPLFFDVATKSLLRDSSKQRALEAPWLQVLFLQLAKCGSIDIPPPTSSDQARPSHGSLVMLKKMLRLAIENRMTIGAAILESIAMELSGLTIDKGDKTIDWAMISLCVELDQKIVLPPALATIIVMDRSIKKPNLLLDRLLEGITRTCYKGPLNPQTDRSPCTKEAFKVVIDGIILPMLNAFIQSRDLPGFIALWQQQLGTWNGFSPLPDTVEQCHLYAFSIWEDEKLLRAVASRLEASMTIGQISTLLEGLSLAIEEHDSSTPRGRGLYFATVAVLDCVLDGIRSESAKDRLKIVVQTIQMKMTFPAISSFVVTPYKWRYWRILGTIAARWQMMANLTNYGEQSTTLAALTSGRLINLLSVPLAGTRSYIEAIFLAQFLLNSVSCVIDVNDTQAQREELSSIPQALLKAMTASAPAAQGRLDSFESTQWDGELATLDSLSMVQLSCSMQLISKPRCLSLFEPLQLKAFFDCLYRSALRQASRKDSSQTSEQEDSSPTTMNWCWLWEQLLVSSAIAEYSDLATALRYVQVENFLNLENKEDDSSADIEKSYAFALSGILVVPVEAFTWDQRARITSFVCSRLLRKRLFRFDHLLVNLLIRFMKFPRRSMEFISSAEYFWALAKKFDLEQSPDKELDIQKLFSLKQLFHFNLQFVLTNVSNDEAKRHVYNCYIQLSQHILEFGFVKPQEASMVLIGVGLDAFSKNSQNFESQEFALPVPDLREIYLHKILQALTKYELDFQGAGYRSVMMLETLTLFSDLLKRLPANALVFDTNTASTSKKSKIDHTVSIWPLLHRIDIDTSRAVSCGHQEKQASSTIYTPEYALTLIRGIPNPLSLQQHGTVVEAILTARSVEEFKTTRATQCQLQLLEQSYLELPSNEKAELLERLTQLQLGQIGKDAHLLQLRKVLGCQYDTSARDVLLSRALASSFSKLCHVLTASKVVDHSTSVLRMQCLDLLLRKTPWAITQWHIDSLLSMIAIFTSRSGPRIVDASPGNIFTSLCRLFGSILALHRTKIGGRYHLMILSLQGLLQCLFSPYAKDATKAPKNNNKNNSLTEPPWLPSQTQPLNAAHAAAYARLLTSICDPSVSAVSRSKNRLRQQLNDETKKARSIAGQNLQYVVMEFCQCQLRGRLTPEVRTALNPGLYAVFGVMGQETMRTVNAALDAAARAVWKVLYEDYQRFGRWEGA